MFCGHCGAECNSELKFCQKCGKDNQSSGDSVKSDFSVKEGSKMAIWNPTWASSLSLIFSAIFGAYLITKNWQSLGNKKEAKKSRIWFYCSIALVPVGMILPMERVAVGLLHFIYLAVWHFLSAKKQIKYVKNSLQQYPRKSMIKPIIFAILIIIIYVVVSVLVDYSLNLSTPIDLNSLACDSEYVRDSIKDVVENAQPERNYKLLDIRNLRDSSRNEIELICLGYIATNYGNKSISVVFEWTSDKSHVLTSVLYRGDQGF